MQQNHDSSRTVAAGREGAIRREITEIAAKVLCAAPNLTCSDRQALKDLQREGDVRYRMRGFIRLLELAATCPEDSDAFALADRFRALTAARRPRPRLTIAVAIERETVAEGAANLVELHLALAQNDLGALARAETALLSQRSALDSLLETVQCKRLKLSGAIA